MNPSQLRLSRFSTRTLNMLASVFGDCGDARVVLSDRSVYPLTVALTSRTIVLQPEYSGLYDLALGAALLRHRPLIKKGPSDPARLDRWLTLKANRFLVADAHAELQARFGRIDRLPGFFRPGSPLTGLRLVDRCIEWEPLKGSKNATAGPPFLQRQMSIEANAVPELEITGADDDFNWIVEALEAGSLNVESLPLLDELPFCRIPLRIESPHRFQLLEEWEHHLSDPENKDSIASLIKCHKDKAVVRERRRRAGRHTFSGVHLDSSRLTEAMVRARIGLPTPIFQNPASNLEPVFDADQFLTVLTFDLNDLRDLSWQGNRSAVLRFLAVLLTCYDQLGVHLIVQGTADQIVKLADGRKVCLHFTSTLKSLDDSFNDVLLPRLAFLMQDSPRLPGTAGCFHAVAADDIRLAFQRATSLGDYSFFTLVWWARHLLDSEPDLRSYGFLHRSANHVDYAVRELEKELDGTLDTMGCFLPGELKERGQNGEFLRSIRF